MADMIDNEIPKLYVESNIIAHRTKKANTNSISFYDEAEGAGSARVIKIEGRGLGALIDDMNSSRVSFSAIHAHPQYALFAPDVRSVNVTVSMTHAPEHC